jgi:hypothetical protein
MANQIYYLIRSKLDGKYLVARIDNERGKESNYLLVFKQDFEALSYLNTHGREYSDRFAVESIVNSQFKGIMQRWGFAGVGMVEDPLIPRIQFLASSFW